MLQNYLKIAWKVLLRRKFFTFISLFGISFTLMILMVATAMIDHVTGPATPEKRLDRMLFVNFIKMTGKSGNMNTFPSYYYMNHYVKRLKTPEKISVTTTFRGVNSYVNNKRLSLDLKFTDANFWEVLDFNFLEGQPFNQQDQKNANRVAVITDHARDQYFGPNVSAVGKYMVADGIRYRVTGVVEDVSYSRFNSYANIWVPLSTAPYNKDDTGLTGSYMAIILADSKADIPKIKEEYQSIVKQVKLPNPKEFDKFYSHTESILEGTIVRQLLGDGENSGMGKFIAIISVVVFLFMLMPTINLVNINVSRIMERSSEIGVRKAFGASSNTLIGQFLVENIFLTLIGGLLGFLLSALVLEIIADSGLIPYAQLGLNIRVFGIGLGLSLIFGFISGVYPAYKMSKLQAVQALKGGQV
ncbi:ABC transporter permease [Adhaeribacter rhizoryzae]|uniref:FtsX-like permease family protein n=1 Tax=Adhaeribacter rhizoryzae TaxID=2607907 RepID=A0A5M6DEY1_9BACT|nr:ABC transporter permease [Adhaeribacter rhizoryzae]KAA5544950.1 FtsX-like permease family protein [Adhaeribacter rhizoryzae]